MGLVVVGQTNRSAAMPIRPTIRMTETGCEKASFQRLLYQQDEMLRRQRQKRRPNAKGRSWAKWIDCDLTTDLLEAGNKEYKNEVIILNEYV